MVKKMESMQKYIEVLEDFPLFHVKSLVMENDNLKAEIQKLKDAPEIGTIGSHNANTPASDLRNMINACEPKYVATT